MDATLASTANANTARTSTAEQADVVLSTLNARYSHTSLALRYLRANLGEWRDRSVIREFIIGQKTEDIAERILAVQPKILGLGVYIWNVVETTQLVAMLKRIAPALIIVLGGPEVSHEVDDQAICQLADYVITGWGDHSFAKLVTQLLGDSGLPRSAQLEATADKQMPSKVIVGVQPPLAALTMPYREYTAEDFANRHVYVEASRGCPFKCEFCLSALDKTAWAFPQAEFLAELDWLYQQGARQFKFIDRTFNLKIDASLAILEFFLDKIRAFPESGVFLHFELVPDHLPDRLKGIIAQFPAGSLQFEVGIQSLNVEVQQRISRKQDNQKAAENLRWLRQASKAHLHVDLIAGLPGESLASFGAGFDQLVALRPHEIQFGILKRLRGTPIIRHTDAFQMRFNPQAPYNILSNDQLSFSDLQRMNRFARYWDLIANSGKFPRGLHRLLPDQPFVRFLAFSDWLYGQTEATHRITPERLVRQIFLYLCAQHPDAATEIESELRADYEATGQRGKLDFSASAFTAVASSPAMKGSATPKRQRLHQRV